MSATQLTNYLLIVLMVVVAVCQGVSTGIDYFASKSKKPLPKQVMTIDEIAKFVVSEAATLDIPGAEKKAKAVQALLDQAKKEGKPITEPVAKGAVQHAYDQSQATQANSTTDSEAQPIGFAEPEDDAKND